MNTEWKNYPITKKVNGSYLVTAKINNQELPYNVVKDDALGMINFTEVEDYYKTLSTDKQLVEAPIIIPPKTLAKAKEEKLQEINNWTKSKIIGGFVSDASGESVTYDSDEDTQTTMHTMYDATKSPNFATHPDYQGVIPVRGYVQGSNIKTVFYLNAAQVQKFMDDMALHIGTSKQEGWAKQKLVNDATTIAELEAIVV